MRSVTSTVSGRRTIGTEYGVRSTRYGVRWRHGTHEEKHRLCADGEPFLDEPEEADPAI